MRRSRCVSWLLVGGAGQPANRLALGVAPVQPRLDPLGAAPGFLLGHPARGRDQDILDLWGRVGRITDACGGADDGRVGGHQVMNPDTVHVLSICDRAGNVRLRDDAYRLVRVPVQDQESGRTCVLHQVGGRLFHRRQRWPHYVRDDGRSRLCPARTSSARRR
jgi:hypothetical protein